MQRWRIDLAWDGQAFVGWQSQPAGGSVQQAVEQAVGEIFGGPPLPVSASGRTDAGVHALHQVAAFTAPAPRGAAALRDGINARLPATISCLACEPMVADFDPRKWATHKLYRYRFLTRRAPCPFRHGHCWHLRGPLDTAGMAQAARQFVGHHDFSSFRAARCSATHAVRTVRSAEVVEQEDEVWFEVVGNGFLRHQVRIMAGTLRAVGLGRLEPGAIATILAARDREAAMETAPAHGLWLVQVELGDGPRVPA